MPDSSVTDAELLSAWLKGRDEKAFHALVARYATLVHQAARRVCNDDALAADASQATFITLVRKARSLSSRPSLAGWLHTTAVLHTRNLLRQRLREARKHELLRSHMDLTPPQDAPASLTWNRLQPHLDAALAKLSESDRETLLLRFYRSLSVADIARTLGIATAAAQKRLDRATERLRRQLSRQGCPAGTDLGSAMLIGFAADRHAAIPSPTLMAGKALTAGAAATATSFTATTLGIIAMTKKTAIIAGAVLVLGAGAIAIATHKSGSDAASDLANAASGAPVRPATGAGSSSSAEEAEKAAKARKEREAARDSAMVAQYGESRTNLSRKIAGDVVGLLEDAVAMGEMSLAPDGPKPMGGPKNNLRRGLGPLWEKLQLTDEQQDKAAEAFTNFQKRKLEETKSTVEDLKKQPQALMGFFLAGDAYKRGETSETEFKQYQKDHAADMAKVMNPLDRKNFQGGQPLQDPAFVAEMGTVLEPAQNEQLQAAATEKTKETATSGSESDISNLPIMDLETLDKKVTAGRQMVTAFKMMMESAPSLQDMEPAIEARKKEKQGGEQ